MSIRVMPGLCETNDLHNVDELMSLKLARRAWLSDVADDIVSSQDTILFRRRGDQPPRNR